jgi:hypothetical protein
VGRLALAQRWQDAIGIFGLIPAGVAIYAGAIWLLKIEGREELIAVFRRMKKA